MTAVKIKNANNENYLNHENENRGFFYNTLNYSLTKSFLEQDDNIISNHDSIKQKKERLDIRLSRF